MSKKTIVSMFSSCAAFLFIGGCQTTRYVSTDPCVEQSGGELEYNKTCGKNIVLKSLSEYANVSGDASVIAFVAGSVNPDLAREVGGALQTPTPTTCTVTGKTADGVTFACDMPPIVFAPAPKN